MRMRRFHFCPGPALVLEWETMKGKNKTEKKKKIAEWIGVIVVILAVTGLSIWSAWFGYDHPQTGLQRAVSSMGLARPTEEAAGKIVFLGDSITAREDWNVLLGRRDILNAGISGNTTDDVLVRLDEATKGQPQKLFLMIGINDLLRGRSVSYVLDNIGKILEGIRIESPRTTVYLESVLPVNNSLSAKQYGTVDSQKIVSLNAKLDELARQQGIVFIDLYSHFCGADNQLYVSYSQDGLHPNARGYSQWRGIISPYLGHD